ncbi:hypothetical protein [Pseudomonas sp. RA_15y_Pfl1_P11]|uniref:hypothetical protein n=1 Tax=Pseudomonas sp. RA_15y_Pfl1_P11 TaxID=3088702 RepID=UPI00403EF8DC
MIGLFGAGSVAGRLLLGSVGDRMGARRLLIVLTFTLVLLNLLCLSAIHLSRWRCSPFFFFAWSTVAAYPFTHRWPPIDLARRIWGRSRARCTLRWGQP